MKFHAKNYTYEQDYPLNRETVWKLLSDTEHLNRFIGLFPVQFSPAKKTGSQPFYREAFAKVGGLIPLKWKEYPFQWVENETYTVERHYFDGPLKHFYGGISLSDSDLTCVDGSIGTKVKLFGSFTPRNLAGVAAIPITGVQSMKNTMTYLNRYLQETHDNALLKLPQKKSNYKINHDEWSRLEKTMTEMPILKSDLDLLFRFLMDSSDQDVAKIRPIPLARQWNADPNQVLRLLLYATKAGILNLSWNLICPNCRVSKADYSSLSQLETQFHCDLCGINYDANFENYVELYFAVHPSIRKAFDQSYCIGGPMITPHVKVQQVIEKGQTKIMKLPAQRNGLRLRVVQVNHILALDFTEKHPKELALQYDDEGWSVSSLPIAPDQTGVRVQNLSDSDIVVVIEKSEWSNDAVTAAKVTAMQEFRDLFSSEVLAPGQQVGIESVTILFSDLRGSTSLYETVGDASAYGQVRRHFDVVTRSIANHGGSVVKTIGDAVMAVFHLPEDGLQAAMSIQDHFTRLNEKQPDELVLKIGLYSGPAIAVNSNEKLDYFGRTVNIAARIQGQSLGNDIILSQTDFEKESFQAILKKESFITQPFQAVLKGINGEVNLIRIKMTGAEGRNAQLNAAISDN